MGFNNYLTSYKLHLLKHISATFKFNDSSGMTEAEIKSYVTRLASESAIPIPSESFEWIASYFKYVTDRDSLLVYDNTTGLWNFETSDTRLRSVLTDYFTIVSEQALESKDQVLFRYANSFFGMSRIPWLARNIQDAITLRIRRSADIINMTENYRYFATDLNTRAILDLTRPVFNLKTVKFSETQPLLLMHISPTPIATVDEEPKLWLSLISEYMLHDPERIEYFKKVLAYLMSPYNYNQALIYFLGESGRNGKSTIVKVLQDILGSHAVRMNSELLNSQPQSSFKKDDALAATEGKSLLIFNEIDERMVASTQAIKDLTEGGRDEFGNKIMTVVRPAYSKNYDVNICGTPLIIANNLINFGDWSALDPIFKRLILVPFDFKIINEDPNLLNKLAAEYPKIQLWLYMNYFKYKGIRIKMEKRPDVIEQRFSQYRADSDIIGMFWKDSIVVTQSPKDEMLRSDVYRMYEQYCKVNGRKPIKNKGTNGFQNLAQPYMALATLVSKAGSFYLQGIRRSASFDAEVKNLY